MLNAIYDYPIEITKVDVKNLLGIDVTDEIFEVLIGAHIYIYDVLIYPTFNEDIKRRIIDKHREVLEKPLKKALLTQLIICIATETSETGTAFCKATAIPLTAKNNRKSLQRCLLRASSIFSKARQSTCCMQEADYERIEIRPQLQSHLRCTRCENRA